MNRLPARSALACLCAVLAGGCVDWRFEAPLTDIVLTRGNALEATVRARESVWPRVRQRQLGLLALANGSALFPFDEVFQTLHIRNHAVVPFKDAVIVTGYHFTDWLIEAVTFSIVKSHTVRIYADVR